MCPVSLFCDSVEEIESWRVYTTSPLSDSKVWQSWLSNLYVLKSDSLQGKLMFSGFFHARGDTTDGLICSLWKVEEGSTKRVMIEIN